MDWKAESEPIHLWFGLTYANYLVLQRSLLQSMPQEWQARFAQCLDELDAAFSYIERPNYFSVSARGEDGKFVKDPVPHYNRGRTRIEPN
jgi:hypothetical protein